MEIEDFYNIISKWVIFVKDSLLYNPRWIVFTHHLIYISESLNRVQSPVGRTGG